MYGPGRGVTPFNLKKKMSPQHSELKKLRPKAKRKICFFSFSAVFVGNSVTCRLSRTTTTSDPPQKRGVFRPKLRFSCHFPPAKNLARFLFCHAVLESRLSREHQGCKKKKNVLNVLPTRSLESVLFVFYFSRPPVFGGNIQRYVTMASIAVDRRRKRLGHGKSNMLVGLFHNLRLLKRMRKLLYTEQCVGWNDVRRGQKNR